MFRVVGRGSARESNPLEALGPVAKGSGHLAVKSNDDIYLTPIVRCVAVASRTLRKHIFPDFLGRNWAANFGAHRLVLDGAARSR
jgi:hypothetical protein